ncbi:MAG: GTPase-activating protein S13 [Bogoriella megaspora]|nr:MAG: GTPase-activating protein S13 [Bogoriella megaspora]
MARAERSMVPSPPLPSIQTPLSHTLEAVIPVAMTFYTLTPALDFHRQKIMDFALHTASVNTLSWSPPETGCLLAAASSDGSISVLEFKDTVWDHKTFAAHPMGVNSVSWAPSLSPGSLMSANPSGTPQTPQRRLVSGGSDNLVKIWDWDVARGWTETLALQGHTDWVRDVAWSPTPLARSYIASASQDQTVRIWTSTDPGSTDPKAWQSTVLQFEAVCWRVSWSLTGNVLAVSGGDNRVSLWKERLGGGWEKFKVLEEGA